MTALLSGGRLFATALACLALGSLAQAASLDSAEQHVRIGVLGLFHSRQLAIRPHEGRPVELCCGDQTLRIEGGQSIDLTLRNDSIECRSRSIAVQTSQAEIRNSDADFALEVPGEIERHYRGALVIVPAADELLATVAMRRETAVASIVAAESPSTSSPEALKAQAVVTRSYLAAGPRHRNFDFCDTTHCQYLGTLPARGEAAAQAASATREMVLAHEGKIIRALYSARCGGQTRTLEDIGLKGRHYPYYRARCLLCVRAPDPWTRRLRKQQAFNLIRQPGNEEARLHLVRQLGWQALPSNNYRISLSATGAIFQGTGSGHGVGLCQHGAAAMATEGHSLLSILRHYFPNTTLRSVPRQ